MCWKWWFLRVVDGGGRKKEIEKDHAFYHEL
jgi:hypothetical protein